MTRPIDYINFDIIAGWFVVAGAAYVLLEHVLRAPQHLSKSLDKKGVEEVIRKEYADLGFDLNEIVLDEKVPSGFFRYDEKKSELIYNLSRYKTNRPAIEKSIDMSKHNDILFKGNGDLNNFWLYVGVNTFYNVKHFGRAFLKEIGDVSGFVFCVSKRYLGDICQSVREDVGGISRCVLMPSFMLKEYYFPVEKTRELKNAMSFIYESQYKKK